MNFKVITTYNNKLYKEYAYRFKETYNWKFDLVVYNEDEDLFNKIPDCKSFVERNKDRPYKNFLKDAVRFSYKVYSYIHAILNEKCDGLLCIDADSVFYKSINNNWVEKYLHREDCMMAYLGRGENQYSECGFLYFNLNHPRTKQYARYMKYLYNNDLIYNLDQYHDSWVWDYARKNMEKKFKVKNHNIGDNRLGHVQARSVLGPIYDHLKGNRKVSGRSPEARANK